MRHFGFPRVNRIRPAFCQQSLPRDKGVYLPFTAASCPYLMGGRGWRGFAEMVPEPQEEKRGKGWEAAL